MEVKRRKYRIEELHRLDAEAYGRSIKLPVVVVLDNVRSLHNVGAFFRTADALMVHSIYLCGITGSPPHTEIHKSALGAEEVVQWSYHSSCVELVKELKEQGLQIWPVEQTEHSVDLDEFISHYRCLNQSLLPVALVFGNEVDGVSQEVIDVSDGTIEIAQYGTKHSLNVSVVGGIVLWEVCRHFFKEMFL